MSLRTAPSGATPAAMSRLPTDARFTPVMHGTAMNDRRRLRLRTGLLPSIIITAAVLGCFQPQFVASQRPSPAEQLKSSTPTPPAPRLPNGHPDLSGVWMGGGGIAEKNLKPGDAILLTPEAKKIMDSRQLKDDPWVNCLPGGVPRLDGPHPWRVNQLPTHKPETHIFILFEGNIHSYRQIFMDVPQHPDDLDPSWYGHSIARWGGRYARC